MCKLKLELLGIEKCICDELQGNCNCVLKHIHKPEQLDKIKKALGLKVEDKLDTRE